MATWDLVIFDNDGVLVDSERAANSVLAGLLTGYGAPITAEDSIARFLGTSLAEVRARIQAEYGVVLPPDFEVEYHRRLFAEFDASLAPVPGVAAVLDEVSDPVCVASSGSPERIRRTLARTGLLDYFDGHLFSTDEVARGKPAPDLFLHAARTMGAGPARSAVIEDSPAGVRAGRAAGMTVYAYAALTPGSWLEAASVVFTDMGELPRLLAGGPSRG